MKKLLISSLIAISVVIPQQAKASEGCSNIVHIGDSLSVHSRKFQEKEYNKLGYPNAVISAHGSRSVLSKMPKDKHTGLEAVKYWKKRTDASTCWVIALGTNDTPAWKYQDVGTRVVSVMRELKGMNVAWVTVWKGKTNNPSARNWNSMLEKKADKYGFSIVYWDKVIAKHKELLNPDGVHYGNTGSRLRAQFIARTVSRVWL
jgi:hypothetical protein